MKLISFNTDILKNQKAWGSSVLIRSRPKPVLCDGRPCGDFFYDCSYSSCSWRTSRNPDRRCPFMRNTPLEEWLLKRNPYKAWYFWIRFIWVWLSGSTNIETCLRYIFYKVQSHRCLVCDSEKYLVFIFGAVEADRRALLVDVASYDT